MAGTRWELWEATVAAIHASFPDRALELIAELESRLEPGPWSADVAGPAPGASRDRMFADIGRALRAADPEGGQAEAQLRELERWLVDSAVEGIRARLGLNGILPDWSQAIVDWAGLALEAGLDTGSLRILAGIRADATYEVDDYLRRTLRELKVERSGEIELRAAARHIAREAVQGRMNAETASRRLYDVAISLPPGNGDFEIWRHMRWEFDVDFSDRSLVAYQREVIDAARAMLGAPPRSS